MCSAWAPTGCQAQTLVSPQWISQTMSTNTDCLEFTCWGWQCLSIYIYIYIYIYFFFFFFVPRPCGLQDFSSLSRNDGEGNGTPLQYSCLENPMNRGAWQAVVHGVAEGQTRLSDFTFTFHFHALEKEMATHSSVLAWRIPGMAEPGGLPSMGSHRVGHDWSDLAAATRDETQTTAVKVPSRNHWTAMKLPQYGLK